ncbi:twin transmembrane helix small protein [Pseudoroseicyclus tamaricis]|uniref:Twin transmembrane helix small protein n=1 Tax=Pseudoroseicyclus tamaricis TaxID=2705421 RepID=A0A6B2K685_9RHOB|nr:twin transmembrane helix small protein [Pseudoroseicyclus tamaricis]NDV02366.1 twin transmembrane helix small protein [Pseudoroseicyclus tamaricis]
MLRDDPLLLLPLGAVLLVAGVLLFGIGTFGRGGEFNKRNANRIMRWRVGTQAFAIAMILLYVWLRSN